MSVLQIATKLLHIIHKIFINPSILIRLGWIQIEDVFDIRWNKLDKKGRVICSEHMSVVKLEIEYDKMVEIIVDIIEKQ